MKKITQIKYQSKTVSITDGTTATTDTTDFEIDEEFDYFDQVLISESTNGGLNDDYNIGIDNGNIEVLPVAPKIILESNDSVAPNDKILDLVLEKNYSEATKIKKGRRVYIRTNFDADLSGSDLEYDIVLRLLKVEEVED